MSIQENYNSSVSRDGFTDSSFDVSNASLTDITGDKSLLIELSKHNPPLNREHILQMDQANSHKKIPPKLNADTVSFIQNEKTGGVSSNSVESNRNRPNSRNEDSLLTRTWPDDSTDENNTTVLSDQESLTKDDSDFSMEEIDSNKIASNDETNEDFELPSTVTVLKTTHGAEVHLIGTAHFSEESQNDVSKVIQKIKPHIVMVELCPQRINILQLDEKTILDEAKNINFEKIRSIIQQNGIFNGLVYILLLNMSAHLTKELGVAPGGEFRRALQEVKKLPQCIIHLGDRPIQVTMHRALSALTWWQTTKLVWRLLTNNESVSKEDVEKYKERELLSEVLSDLGAEFPALKNVFVHERDTYLTHSLQIAASSETACGGPIRVVGVVGMGHVPGILENWGKITKNSIVPIMQIPPPTLSSRILKMSFKASFVGLLIYGGSKIIPKKWIM